jgi:hypothetical protein
MPVAGRRSTHRKRITEVIEEIKVADLVFSFNNAKLIHAL